MRENISQVGQRTKGYLPISPKFPPPLVKNPSCLNKLCKNSEISTSLYNLPVQTPPPQTQLDAYISSSQLPLEVQEALEAPIAEEIQREVCSSKPGKAPGPDGFTLHYYKLLLQTLGPYMVRLFNELGSETVFPRETLKAHASVIPKEGKEPTSCGSYRSISLLNCDLKLFTKIISSSTTSTTTGSLGPSWIHSI